MSDEWAILDKGAIVNVVATSGGRASAERVAANMTPAGMTVAPLLSLPLATREEYRYWSERP